MPVARVAILPVAGGPAYAANSQPVLLGGAASAASLGALILEDASGRLLTEAGAPIALE